MELVKNIAAIIGVILSATSLIALLSKTFRKAISKIFKKYGNTDEVSESVEQIKSLLERHIQEEKDFKDGVMQMDSINLEFMKTQCRNNIKTIFYKYKDTKVLPLYEKKTLMTIEELYINKLHGNSFAAFLLKIMSRWEVDYENTSTEYIEDDNA